MASKAAADLASWVVSFVFIDGKMRGLFSFLFGASTLLVIERAEAAGESPAQVHYARMFWLLVFGLIHFYFIWFGDILALYALIGLILYFFRKLSVRALLRWGVALVLAADACCSPASPSGPIISPARPRPRPTRPRPGARCRKASRRSTGAELADKLALFRGAYSGAGPGAADRASRSSRSPALRSSSAARLSPTCCSAWRR